MNKQVLYAEVPVTKNLFLKEKVGYTLGRDYPVYNHHDKLHRVKS